MTDEFVFRVPGESGFLSLADIDLILKEIMQRELDRIENHLIELFGSVPNQDVEDSLRRSANDKIERLKDRPVEVFDTKPGKSHHAYNSIGKMPLGDVLTKFR